MPSCISIQCVDTLLILTSWSHSEQPCFDAGEEFESGLQAVGPLGCGGEERGPLLSDERIVAGPQCCDVDPAASTVLGGVTTLDQAPGLQAAQSAADVSALHSGCLGDLAGGH